MKRFLIFCAFCAFLRPAFGANEIRSFNAGATTCFGVIRNASGQVWYPVGSVFEAWGTGARTAADYDIALTNKSGGMFVGTMDTNIAAGYYTIVSHQQAGGSPADTDPAIWQEYGNWSGTIWTPANFSDMPTKEEIRAEIDSNSTDLNTLVSYSQEWDPNFTAILADTSAYDTDAEHAAAIWNALMATYTIEASFGGEVQQLDPNLTLVLADTNELQTDWTNGGRLDLLIDAILEDTGTTLPNQITALVVPDPAGTAASLHIITDALINDQNDLSSAQVEAAVAAALATYDPPTKAEMDVGFASITVDNAAIADAVHDEVVEGTVTLRQALRLFLSVMTGKSSGGGTTSITFRDIGDTKDRLKVTVDSKGNRTAVTTRDGN
jgi:hypothetical protein